MAFTSVTDSFKYHYKSLLWQQHKHSQITQTLLKITLAHNFNNNYHFQPFKIAYFFLLFSQVTQGRPSDIKQNLGK